MDDAALAAHDRYGERGVVVWAKDRDGTWAWRVCRVFAGRPHWPIDKCPAGAEQEDLDDEN